MLPLVPKKSNRQLPTLQMQSMCSVPIAATTSTPMGITSGTTHACGTPNNHNLVTAARTILVTDLVASTSIYSLFKRDC